jgi:NAD(P)-dependent dehydrogenase (short-subunit alcohol dehydrogenase family)
VEQLGDTTVVVTGATRGIGKVTALHLAERGARVFVVGRNTERGQRVEADIVGAGGRGTFLACDLTVEDQVAALFDEVRQRAGSLDVVVNNAAATDVVSRDGPVVDLRTEDFDHFLSANVRSVFWCFKYGIPAMGGRGGTFVTVSSVEAITPRAGEPAYSASKAAVCGLSRQVAVDYGHRGISANTLVLGFIETNASRALLEDRRIGERIRGATGGQPPTSLDVARAVAFLATSGAAGFNGATLVLDRGLTVTSHVPSDMTLGL